MLTKLLKPAWQSGSLENRLKAISAMDGTNAKKQEILIQLTDDKELSICIAAIVKVSSITSLHKVSLNHESGSVRAAAEKRINELMSEKGRLDKTQYTDLLKRYPELITRVTAFADTPQFVNKRYKT